MDGERQCSIALQVLRGTVLLVATSMLVLAWLMGPIAWPWAPAAPVLPVCGNEGFATGAAAPGRLPASELPVWLRWNLRPEVLLALGTLAWLYRRGLHRLWQATGRGRVVRRVHAMSFALGIAALLLALVSPIEVLAEELSWVHMIQHELLMMAAAPLLVLGSTLLVLLWALPPCLRRAFARGTRPLRAMRLQGYLLWHPLLTWVLFAATIWSLHLPALYLGALRHRLLHDLQHVAFLVTACLFWRVVLDPLGRLRLAPGLSFLYLFTTTLHASALGVLMAFSPHVWYGDYAGTTPAWHLEPLEDQQLAGYFMWMTGCVVYALVAALTFGSWLREAVPGQGPRAGPTEPQPEA